MAISFDTIGNGLTRDGSFLAITQDWTRTGWIQPFTGNADFRTYWNYGDANFALSYIWLGGTAAGNVQLEFFNGSVAVDTVTVPAALDTWYSWGVVYDSNAHTVKFYFDGNLIDTLSIDLTTYSFSIKDEYAGADTTGSYSNLALGYFGTWQEAMSLAQLQVQWQFPNIVMVDNILAFNPMTGPDDLVDISNHNHDWQVYGEAGSTIDGPFPSIPVIDSDPPEWTLVRFDIKMRPEERA